MSRVLLPAVLTLAGAAVCAAQAPQDHHAHMTARGQKTMGFDQEATVHHFFLYQDGGTIQVTVKDSKDRTNLTAIRTHLPQLVTLFAAGDFSMPHFIHGNDTPGTATMARLRDRIVYAYEDVPGGGRVHVTTRHGRALAAVHEFLRFQITDHKTGDALHVRPRG